MVTRLALDTVIKQALEEDIRQGDITSDILIDESADATAHISAKEDFILAGSLVAARVFEIIDPDIRIRTFFNDGDSVRSGDTIITLDGGLRNILAGERVALNFLARLCGIATMTRRYVEAVKGSGVKIYDTRKTTPNLRYMEKEAVIAGGGYNHRFGLYDGILIKDNHVKYCGGVAKAVFEAKKHRMNYVKIEVEVKSLAQVREAITAGADIIMLDNMPPDTVKEALAIVGGKAVTEVSGGVTMENVADYAKRSPDFISVGALTHSARAVDISLLIE